MSIKIRVIAYIDGFNLYHGLKEQGWRWAYWLNLQSLILKYIEINQELVLTKYFTSRVTNAPDKQKRQATFIEALSTLKSFKLYFGKYYYDPVECFNCGRIIDDYHEKMTDVNIATEMLTDAFQNKYDMALILSGDSDLVPPINAIHRLFPGKRIICLFPPRRVSKSLKNVVDGFEYIDDKKISKSLFPDQVIKLDGHILRRPDGWK